jgi:hypothetical protein
MEGVPHSANAIPVTNEETKARSDESDFNILSGRRKRSHSDFDKEPPH